MSGEEAISTPRRSMSRFNRFFVAWLASPCGYLSGRARLVRYTGRVTGRRYRLPVRPAPSEDGYVIRVGDHESKVWWRNFTSPWPIEIVRGRSVIRGTGVAVPGSTGRGQAIACEWFATHHGAARRAGLPRFWKGEEVTQEQLQAAAAQLMFVVVTPER
jgi:hypothetical protein